MLASHLIVILICFLSFGAYWIYHEYSLFKDDSAQLRQDFLKSQNTQIQAEVEKAVGYIEFAKKQLQERLKQTIKEKVAYAHTMAKCIVDNNQGKLTEEELEVLVRNILRDLSFFNGRGYYFATDNRGKFKVYPIAPEKEGYTVADRFGPRGSALNKKLLKIAAEKGQGFLTYTWEKPGQSGSSHEKLSYVMHFEPFDWLIGAGEYLDDWQELAQKQVADGLASVLFGQEGYLFAGTYDGISLIGPDRGKNMINVADLHGKLIVQELIKAAKQGGGFVEYVMPAIDGKRQAAKMSFAMGVPGWDWYVGAGYYFSEIDGKIAKRQAELESEIRWRIVFIVCFILGLSLFAAILSRIMTRKLVRELDVFKKFFQQAAESNQPVAASSLKTSEFIELAQAANLMIEQRQEAQAEKERMESQLLQSQKMEAVGTLAGGVAHDFNNLLAIISGYTELALANSVQGVSSEYELEQVQKAAMRGKDLVRQILTFSRHAEPNLKPMDINQVVNLTTKILEHTLPKMITIDVCPGKKLWPILGDANQVEQVLLNLGSNSKDAMPEGGRMVIETLNLELTAEHLRSQPEAIPGRYVLMRIADNGVGMDEETQKHVFEPFFTTKEVGKGTGLGLSTVFGIVKSHGGHLTCDSQPGRGTEINIYWPAAPQAEAPIAEPKPEPQAIEGSETILIVDDEAGIREVSERIFSMAGYGVLLAESGESALEIYSQEKSRISLVILDLGMPGMGGYRCLEALKEKDPGIKVVVASGYSQDREVRNALQMGAAAFVPKPFTAKEILRSVRGVLDNAVM